MMDYSNEERLKDGLKSGVFLFKKNLSSEQIDANKNKLLRKLNIDSGDLAGLVMDALELASYMDVNLGGEVLRKISQQHSNH